MTTGNYSHMARVGEGNMHVHCTFDVSSDGDIENLQVHDGQINVTPYLCEYQIEEIESEAWAHYERECKENNDDLLINQFLAGAV